jgi:hypothetical protein
MSDNKMRLICEFPKGVLRNNMTTVNNIGTVGATLKNVPGVGEPFLIFANPFPVPPAMVDFDKYPQYRVSAVVSENVAMIEEQLANPPLDALTFPPSE